MEDLLKIYVIDRIEWRAWLEEHYTTAKDVWLIYPKKASGKPRILYNDAVEEALCFGWIDSTVRSLDEMHTMQRFSPRRPKSSFSQANKERLKWLAEAGLLLPPIREAVQEILEEGYVFPEDILMALQSDEATWGHFQNFSAPYQRIRVAYIEAARKRPEEFTKRLENFLKKTQEGILHQGFGGIDKYY